MTYWVFLFVILNIALMDICTLLEMKNNNKKIYMLQEALKTEEMITQNTYKEPVELCVITSFWMVQV